MSNLVLQNKQTNKYFMCSAIAEAKCHFENLNTRRFWEFALEKIRSIEKFENLKDTQNFYIKDADFLNNHPMIKSKKIGTEELMTKIVTDIKNNNFYQAFQRDPNSLADMPNIAIVSIIMRQKSKGRTFIRFNNDFISFVSKIKSYTTVNKKSLLECKSNEIYDLFKLLKKWEKAFPKEQEHWNKEDKRGIFEITIKAIRHHFNIQNGSLTSNIALTRSLKRKCQQINEYKDIQVGLKIIKINNKTVGYRFEIESMQQITTTSKPMQQAITTLKPMQQATITQRMMKFKIKGKAVMVLRDQYSQNEIEAGLFVLEKYDPKQITSSNLSFLIGIIQNQTGKKYISPRVKNNVNHDG